MTDIHERHTAGPFGSMQYTDWDGHPLCAADRQRWPCDAIQQADRADKAEADAGNWRALLDDTKYIANKTGRVVSLPEHVISLSEAHQRAAKAEAIARELAEALRKRQEWANGQLLTYSVTAIKQTDDLLARFDAEYGIQVSPDALSDTNRPESITVALTADQFDLDDAGRP